MGSDGFSQVTMLHTSIVFEHPPSKCIIDDEHFGNRHGLALPQPPSWGISFWHHNVSERFFVIVKRRKISYAIGVIVVMARVRQRQNSTGETSSARVSKESPINTPR